MASTKKVDLCLSLKSLAQAHAEVTSLRGESNAFRDTEVVDAPEIRAEMINSLERLRIGNHTVAGVLRGLETLLGQELHPSRIIQDAIPWPEYLQEFFLAVEGTKVFVDMYEAHQARPSSAGTAHKPSNIDPSISNQQPIRKAESLTIYDITDGGETHTDMVRPPRTPTASLDDIFVQFQTQFSHPPLVIVGLNYLHISQECLANVGHTGAIWGSAEHIGGRLFGVCTEGTNYNVAGFTWLAVPGPEHPLLQCGSFSHHFSDYSAVGISAVERQEVHFKNSYESAPKVVVWFSGFQSYTSSSTDDLMVNAEQVSPTGFTVCIERLGRGPGPTYVKQVKMAGISWFAYPADTPDIRSGDFKPKENKCAGVITFEKEFAKPPRRVLVALTRFEIQRDWGFRISHEAVSAAQMVVKIASVGDSTIKTIEAAYIAMA